MGALGAGARGHGRGGGPGALRDLRGGGPRGRPAALGGAPGLQARAGTDQMMLKSLPSFVTSYKVFNS